MRAGGQDWGGDCGILDWYVESAIVALSWTWRDAGACVCGSAPKGVYLFRLTGSSLRRFRRPIPSLSAYRRDNARADEVCVAILQVSALLFPSITAGRVRAMDLIFPVFQEDA